jgi:uncharacterized protein (DUF1800 family)
MSVVKAALDVRSRGRFGPFLALAGAVVLAAGLSAPALAQVRPGGGGFGGGTRPSTGDDAFLVHVLNRTTYGPTEKSLAEIRAMGADAWLWRQLHPETIDDSVVTARLATELPATTDLDYQWAELSYAFLVRQAHSERQLEAVMTQFWENHFDTVVAHGNNDNEWYAWAAMERKEGDAFRTNAFGRFRTLLEVSAKSQAMMYFLDNYQNTVRTGNENYARELLELHSLGVDCGYQQFDVEQVARIFTGWTGIYISRTPPNPADPRHVVEGDFFFNGAVHDARPKPDPSVPTNPRQDVLGTTFPAGGFLDEGLRVLDIVSEHPCTARFLSRKLIEAFVTDVPTEAYVDRIADRWMDSDGDVREVLWAIFKSPEFRDPRNFSAKVKTPLEQALSVYRATNGTMAPNAMWNGYEWPWMYYFVFSLGQRLFDFNIPTGYPERGGPWISANGFLQRWKFADDFMFLFPRAGQQVQVNPMADVARLGLPNADAVIDHYARLLLGGKMDATRRQLLTDVLVNPTTRRFDPADGGQDARLRETISQMLGFPEFNEQ